MATTLNAVRGMNDVLPRDAAIWERLEDAAREVFAQYGYGNIRVPIVETTPLFVRGIGDATDIVEREMYTFEDKLNGESLTLRPEATAGIVRAAIEHSLVYERPQRVWTTGPMFRHERPQRGRYRQFHQINAEALGFPGPDVDAEHMVLLARLWRVLGLADGARLKINSLGDPDERRAHRADLIAYFQEREGALDADAKRRLKTNPLRILDSKNPEMQEIVHGAPQLIDRLGSAAREHFDGVQRILSDNGIAYEIDARLVRGLDYYNRTVFEFTCDRLGAQSGLGGGGRYDGLVELLGGPATPAVGWAAGVERILLAMETRPEPETIDVFVVTGGDRAAASALVRRLRDDGLAADLDLAERSFKGQMKQADRSRARHAISLEGDGTAKLRDMSSGEQRDVDPGAIATELVGMSKTARP